MVILGHFLPFYSMKTPKIKILKNQKISWRYHFIHMYQKSQSWCIVPEIWSATDRIFCHYRFFALLPPMDPENQTFEKMKKTLEDIIILQMFTINDSHMIYGFSDIECNRQIFFVILDCFLPFYPPNNLKNKIFWKIEKRPWRYYFTQVYQKSWSYICYTVP